MKTKIEHSGIKSRHKYLGSGSITSMFGVIAFVALVCLSMMSSTASCGVPQKIDELNNQLAAFEARVEALSVEIQDAATGGLTSAKTAIINNTDAAEMAIIANMGSSTAAIIANTDEAEGNINQFIRDTHLVDAFDVAVGICAEIGGGAEIDASAGLGVPATLEANLGIDFFGSGVEIGIEPNGEIGIGIGLHSGVGMSVTACINGIFTRQLSDANEEAALIASVDASDQAFVAELIEVGNNFRGRVKGTAEATNLVVVSPGGGDRLNNSLDAFEGVTTLNPALLAQFILNSFSGPFGNLVGDLCDSGNGMDTVLSDIGGIVNLGSSGVGDIVGSISSGIPGLNLGAGGAGLNSLSLANLGPIKNTFDSFEDIDDAVDSVKTAVDSVISFFNDAISTLNDVIACLEDPLSCI